MDAAAVLWSHLTTTHPPFIIILGGSVVKHRAGEGGAVIRRVDGRSRLYTVTQQVVGKAFVCLLLELAS